MESKARLWTGRILSAVTILFLLMDSGMKVVRARPAVEGTIQVGYPEGTVAGIGILLLACTILYMIPRTAILGAVLLTGYLGGAVATQVRVTAPLFSHILFPVYMGVMVWGALLLRDNRLGVLISSDR